MARATQLGTSSAAANARPPPSAPAPSPSIARMTADTTSDLKEIKQTTHASRTQRPRLRGARDIECTDPTVDQEHDDHGLENNKALDTFDTFTLAQFPQRAECCNSEPRNRKSRPQPEGGQDLGEACDAELRHSTANHGNIQALKVDKISEERATSDYAAPPQTVVVRKRHWRVSPRRQPQRHSRRRWGADQSQQSRRGSQQPPARQSSV